MNEIREKIYPEHEKLRKVIDKSDACGDFLEWLKAEKRFFLARYHQHDEGCYETHHYLNSPPRKVRTCGSSTQELYADFTPVIKLLEEYFKIDGKKLEAEKREMLSDLRAESDKRKKDSRNDSRKELNKK